MKRRTAQRSIETRKHATNVSQHKHSVIIVLGLGEASLFYRWLTRNWERKYNLIPYIHIINWKDNAQPFNLKLLNLEKIIRDLVDQSDLVSLIGISAGASAVLNAYFSLQKKGIIVNGKIITICGRANMNTHWWYPLEYGVKCIPSFETSVIMLMEYLKRCNTKKLNNVITFRAAFDEVVPSSASMIKGVKNNLTFFISHNLTIYGLLSFKNPLIPILKS